MTVSFTSSNSRTWKVVNFYVVFWQHITYIQYKTIYWIHRYSLLQMLKVAAWLIVVCVWGLASLVDTSMVKEEDSEKPNSPSVPQVFPQELENSHIQDRQESRLVNTYCPSGQACCIKPTGGCSCCLHFLVSWPRHPCLLKDMTVLEFLLLTIDIDLGLVTHISVFLSWGISVFLCIDFCVPCRAHVVGMAYTVVHLAKNLWHHF